MACSEYLREIVRRESVESFRKKASLSSRFIRRVDGEIPESEIVMMWLRPSMAVTDPTCSASGESIVGRTHSTIVRIRDGKKR